ncbi:MAG: hypothetical protein Q4C85_07345 [Actinomyces sp.]|uniref:hypothetical protein n=1 Tax=Actinomyces sp. TaxID=29317 RepID=UPI0026DD1DE4|nr:hypothetical protein [Actinomyces sp.]MDO4243558.1 hypothetical protein [Actinomyces sp.]
MGEAIGSGLVSLVQAGWSRHRERQRARREAEAQRRQWDEQPANAPVQQAPSGHNPAPHRLVHQVGALWAGSSEERALTSWAHDRERLAVIMDEVQETWDRAWGPAVRRAEKETSVSRRSEWVWLALRFLTWLSPYVLAIGIVLFLLSWVSPGIKFVHRLLLLAGMLVGLPVLQAVADGTRSRAAEVTRRLNARAAKDAAVVLRDRYGLDPRDTHPWLGELSAESVRRGTEAVLDQVDATGALPRVLPGIEPLRVRDPEPRMPAQVRHVLITLAAQPPPGFQPPPADPQKPGPSTGGG